MRIVYENQRLKGAEPHTENDSIFDGAHTFFDKPVPRTPPKLFDMGSSYVHSKQLSN